MKRDEAKAFQDAAQHAADWCFTKLEMRSGTGGYGKEHVHSEAERTALHLVHSIAVCEIARMTAIIAR
jgi:hypothetical protein